MCCSLGVIFEEKSAFKQLQNFLGGKSANELIHSSYNFEFTEKPLRTKRIQRIGLKFIGTVNHAVVFQYSEQMFL